MKSKRIISGLLALTFVFGGAVVPSNVVNNISFISASAENQFISEPFYCTELDDGTVRIDSTKSDWRNLETAAVIPSKIDGKKVTRIGRDAFYKCKFTSVELPNTITHIGINSFYNCVNLKSIVIPESVKMIDNYAFQYCTSLESVSLNEGLLEIRIYAFDGCKNLKSIEIPSSVRCIGDNAFNNCTNLAEIHISKGTQSLEIGKNAFYNCQSLTNIKIPNSVTRIDNCAFSDCTSLKSISLPDSLEFLGEYNVFTNCTSLENVNIPTSLKEIPSSTFSGCIGLTSITIPDNITKIGNGAFCGCTGLKRIWIPASVESIGSNAFDYYNYNDYKYYPLKNLTIYCYPNTAAEMYAKANGLNYKFLGSPKNIKYTYSQAYHQLQFTWDKVKGADRYSIAVYQAGKWVIQKDNITTNSFVTPKNLTPGKTYKVAIAARVDGIWDKENAIKNAVTVTIPADKDGYDIYDLDPNNSLDYSFLNDEIYRIGMYHDDENYSLPIEVTSESSVKISDTFEYECDEEQYFRFKWCNNGYKIYSVKYEDSNKVLTINQSGEVVLEEDKNLLSQIWEVLPYGKNKYGDYIDGLRIRSKICYTSDCKPTSYFLSYNGSKLIVTNKEVRNKVKIFSPTVWKRFGELYLNCMGWEKTNVPTGISQSSVDYTIENYIHNIGYDLKENTTNYYGHDLLVKQDGGVFKKLKFHEQTMDGVCCEIMGTYNALVLHNEPVDFFKLAAEFEMNATSTAPSGDSGWAGSDPYKIGNCLDAYNVNYTTIDRDDYLAEYINSNDINIFDSSEADYNKIIEAVCNIACDEFDKELKNGVCGIISYNWPWYGIYEGIHTYATEYSSLYTRIITFNEDESVKSFVPYASTYEALKEYDDSGKLQYTGRYLVGYVLK